MALLTPKEGCTGFWRIPPNLSRAAKPIEDGREKENVVLTMSTELNGFISGHWAGRMSPLAASGQSVGWEKWS